MKQIAQIEKKYMKEKVPTFKSGDTVRVHVKIKEGDKERIQVFQGTVIGRRGGGINETFTVRKMSSGVGVERIFQVHSPNVERIERVRQGKVRQAKLYYLRGLTGKSARIEERLEDKIAEAVEEGEEKPAKTKKKRRGKAKKAKETEAAEVEVPKAEENREEGSPKEEKEQLQPEEESQIDKTVEETPKEEEKKE